MDRLDAMQAFVRLTDLGSFTAVAQDLRVGQSTISKWVAALEEELGTQLVARTTRRVRITEAGRRFATDARDLLAAYDGALHRLDPDRDLRGRLRISAPVVFGRLYVLAPVKALMRRHPGLAVELLLSDRYVSLVDDDIDVAVRVGTPADSSLRQIRLGGTGRAVVASPGYVERHGEPGVPADLAAHAALLHAGLPSGPAWSFRAEAGGPDTRIPLRARFVSNNSDALLAMAKAGLGVAMLADWLVQGDLAAGRLVRLLPSHTPAPAPINALCLPSSHPRPAVRACIEELRTAFATFAAVRRPRRR